MSESAPRISEKAVEFWAERQHGPLKNYEPIIRKELVDGAREDLTAILPLLCGEPEKQQPVEGGCQKPDACEWNWWPEHCQCRSSEGKRTDAPEPPEMVERNRLSAAEETNARAKRDQERVEAATSYLRKAEARAEALTQQLNQVREEVERLRDEAADLRERSIANDPDGYGAARLRGRAQGREAAADRLQAILDSSPSLSGGGESSDDPSNRNGGNDVQSNVCCRSAGGRQHEDHEPEHRADDASAGRAGGAHDEGGARGETGQDVAAATTNTSLSGDVEERGEESTQERLRRQLDEDAARQPHPEDGRRWEGWRGPLTALLGALRRQKPLCFNGNVLVAFTADVPDADLWKAQAEMVLDADDLAALDRFLASTQQSPTTGNSLCQNKSRAGTLCVWRAGHAGLCKFGRGTGNSLSGEPGDREQVKEGGADA